MWAPVELSPLQLVPPVDTTEPAATVVLSFTFLVLLIYKETLVTRDDADVRTKQSADAVLLSLGFAFGLIVLRTVV
jgi:hypothetical protein